MKKTIQKLLSVILVAALCVSAICSSVIGAYAATAGKTYSVVGSDIAAGTKVITMEVTLTDPAGMTNGKFDLMLGKDVIDDANFGTKLNDKGETVPDYDNYLSTPNSFTLADLVGEKTETRVETTEVTNDFEWRKDTATATQWSTSDPDGAELGWQSTGNTQTKDNWVKVDGSTQYATSDPDGSALAWQSTGNTKTQDNWKESTVDLRLSAVPANTATVTYERVKWVKDNWDTKIGTVNFKYGERPDTSTGEWVYTGNTIQGEPTGNVKSTSNLLSADIADTDYYIYVRVPYKFGDTKKYFTEYHKLYVYDHYSNDPTYTYTKRVNTPVTTYEYQQYQNKSVTETEYQKYNKVYFKTVVSYGESKLDIDGNNMIANINTYEERDVTVPVYDENGNQTGTTTVKQMVLISEHKEPLGNKGTLLPNAYDNVSGLWNTKIEITGGTKLGGGDFDIKDFVNNDYSSLAGTTTYAKAGEEADGRKYVYNMTDDYYESLEDGKYLTTTDVTVEDGETTKTVKKYATDKKLLNRYYREYTTVDVATQNLGYKISTVSEDSVDSMPAHSQYAQGFKDITFNTASAYTSITFTVTLDFGGICDRGSANQAVEKGNETGTADDGVTVYRNNDAHTAAENYVHYGKKYQLNLINAQGDAADLAPVDGNDTTNFSHVHDGHISQATGKADPSNIEAIKAAGLEKADNKTYFNIFDAQCNICGRMSPMLASTDLPYREHVYEDPSNPNVATGTIAAKTGMYSFNSYRNLSGVNLTYQEDGTVSLNIHVPNTMEGEKFIITDQNGKVLPYSDTVPASESKYLEVKDENEQDIGLKKPSFYAAKKIDDGTGRYDGILLHSARMITIDNLSAKDADITLYIARYTPVSSTETQLMGITHTISLADYCRKVVNGEGVYYLNSEGKYNEIRAEQDKMVAAAFMNYANASKNALGTPAPADDEIVTIPTDIDLLEFGDYLINDLDSTSKWYDTNVADNGETGDSWENAIIIDSAEELVYLCKGSGNETKGKYYKVADNILGFNLASSALDVNGTLADNLDVIKGSGKNHAGGTPGFQGYFDGNGATVYGAWSNHNTPSTNAGLFTCTKGEVIIKNINVNKAHFTATTAAGGIVGYYMGEGNYTNNTTLTIENCSVTDSYLEVTGTGYNTGIGTIVGRVDCPSSYVDVNDEDGDKNTSEKLYVNNQINVKNCYVNLDEAYFTSAREDSSTVDQICHGGAVAVAGTNAVMVSNCIIIGVTPYPTTEYTAGNAIQHTGHANNFSNVYTDQPSGTSVYVGGSTNNGLQNLSSVIFQRTKDQLTGENAKTNTTGLNWDTVWCVNDGDYPTLYAPYNIPTPEPKPIYWDGTSTKTAPTEGSGTKDDPYIIRTVAELAYIFGQGRDNYAITDGKYYKIADGITSIVMQPEAYAADIMALSSAADTKAYFETNASKMKQWLYYGWEGSTFCGNIDFNGATVYGIYQVSSNNAGFISNVDAGAVISNLTIKNSYMVSNSPDANYQCGAIAAVTNGSGYGKSANGFIWFNGCTVANNYMYNNSTSNDRSGVIIGASSDLVYIDNCFVYGNDTTYGSGVKMNIWSSSNNNVLVSSAPAIPEGLVVVDDGAADARYYNMVRNSVFLGAAPYDVTQEVGARFNDTRCFKNVYTDVETTNVACAKGTVFTAQLSQMTKINANEINGLSAKTNMPNLDWYDIMTNPTGSWHYSYFGGMPTLEAVNNSIVDDLAGEYPEYAAAYNSIQFTPDTLGAGTEYIDDGSIKFGVYASGLNLKANPYITFTFAFTKEYRAVRDQIKITITTSKGSYELPAMVAANGDEDVFFKQDGWTHNEGSGRYHLYRFNGISISEMVGDMTVTAYDPLKGETVELGRFSVGGFGQSLVEANEAMPCDYYETRIEATKALMFYIQAVNTRYGA